MRWLQWLAPWLCRHQWIVKTQAGRLYLECLHCGTATPGWQVTAP